METIGSFAEKMIQESLEDVRSGKASAPTETANAPRTDPTGQVDISRIEVPKETMGDILEGYKPGYKKGSEYAICTSQLQSEKGEKPKNEAKFKRCKSKVRAKISDSVDVNQKLGEVIGSLVPLLEQLKNSIKDMRELSENLSMGATTTGQIGVNLAGGKVYKALKKKKKKTKT